MSLLIGGSIVAGIALFVWLMIWLITPEQKTGTVTDLTWKTSISLQEYTTIEDEGWDVPIGARIIKSEERWVDTIQEFDHFDIVKMPVTKYKKVQDEDSVWTTMEDLGNGFDEEVEYREEQYHEEPYTVWEDVKVPVYKDVDIYEDWYWYEYDEWITIDTKTTSGHKGTEHDPVLTDVSYTHHRSHET